MKKHNGKKGKDNRGSKHQHKSAARFKTLTLTDNANGFEKLLVPQAKVPATRLKAMVVDIKTGDDGAEFSDDELINTKAPPKKLSKAEKKAVKKQRRDERKQAEIVPIGRNSDSKKKQLEQEAEVISKLEKHIAEHTTTAINDECAIVGPPKPDTPPKGEGKRAKLTVVQTTPRAEVTGKTTPSVDEPVHKDLELYGSRIRDTGEGMTPSGQTIASFEDGSWKQTSWVTKPVELHSVITPTAGDYTYEELAELNDLLQLEVLEMKTDYEQRLSNLNDRLSRTEQALFDTRQANAIKGFNQAHSGGIEEAVVNKTEELAIAHREIEEQRREIDRVMNNFDMLQNYVSKKSVNSKATLKTLALQYKIYETQFKDNPMRSFFRHSGYHVSQLNSLRRYFDVEKDVKLIVAAEREAYKRMANRKHKMLRWACRTRDEIKSLRRIAVNTAVMRPEPVAPDWLCKKLHSVTTKEDVGATNIYNFRFSPLAEASSDVYCKVWEGFKAVTPRAEYEVAVVSEAKEAKLKSIANSKIFKAVLPVVKAGKAINNAMNYELSSKKRSEIAQLNIKKAEEASRIKREREAAFEREVSKDDELARIKKAQRMAY